MVRQVRFTSAPNQKKIASPFKRFFPILIIIPVLMSFSFYTTRMKNWSDKPFPMEGSLARIGILPGKNRVLNKRSSFLHKQIINVLCIDFSQFKKKDRSRESILTLKTSFWDFPLKEKIYFDVFTVIPIHLYLYYSYEKTQF